MQDKKLVSHNRVGWGQVSWQSRLNCSCKLLRIFATCEKVWLYSIDLDRIHKTESYTSTCICMCVLYKCIIQCTMLGGPQITWGSTLRDSGKCPQVCNQYWGNTQDELKTIFNYYFFPPEKRKKLIIKTSQKWFKVPSNPNYSTTLWFCVLI